MENKKSNTSTNFQNGIPSQGKPHKAPVQSSQLMKLFEDHLKDLYRAKKAVTKTIPKMSKRNNTGVD